MACIRSAFYLCFRINETSTAIDQDMAAIYSSDFPEVSNRYWPLYSKQLILRVFGSLNYLFVL